MPRKPKKADLPLDLIPTESKSQEPKPVAKMKVSVSGKSITKLEVPRVIALSGLSPFSAAASSISDNDGEESSFSKKTKSKDEKKKKTSENKKIRSKEEVEAIDRIWEHLSDGDIDLKYATVGYGFNGRPILDHDIFVNLLINYGFTIGPILDFIDDFNEVSMEDEDFPLVMVNSHMSTIYQEVENLDKTKDDESKS